MFFQGAGVKKELTSDLYPKVHYNRELITKYEIVRVVLTRLNEKGEKTLGERREILKRVVEFEGFDCCWPDDQLKAKGLVAEIRRIINVKDSFTRMHIEREKEAETRREENKRKVEQQIKRREKLSNIKNRIGNLFHETNPQQRGRMLETVLNELFNIAGMLVRESFTLCGTQGEGIVEQVDGVIEVDGSLYLVEMKWWNKPLDKPAVSEHLVRVYHRGHAKGIVISASGYTAAAIDVCREALSKTTVVMCELREIVLILEQEKELAEWLKKKIQAAIIEKDPYFICLD